MVTGIAALTALLAGCGGTDGSAKSVGNAAALTATEYKFTVDQPLKFGLNTRFANS